MTVTMEKIYMTRNQTSTYRRLRRTGNIALWSAVTVGAFSTAAYAGTGFEFNSYLWASLGLVTLLLIIAMLYFAVAGRVTLPSTDSYSE
jgi:hypothetical protein